MAIWFGSATEHDRHMLQRTIWTAEKITGCSLPILQDLFTSRARNRVGRSSATPRTLATTYLKLYPLQWVPKPPDMGRPVVRKATRPPSANISGCVSVLWPVGMVLEGSSEALCPPPSLELRSPCNRSQGPPAHPHLGLYPGDKEPVKYGELIVLGYNGSLANGDKGRRRSRLALYKRPKANGVKPDVIHNISTPLVSKALSNKSQHSISYTLSRSHSVIVEYTHDSSMDMFQIGRSTENMIDFVVTDTSASGQAGAGGEGGQSAQSTISRYACRILCERSPPYTTRIYAAGFDSSKNIFLGERAAKWRTSDGLMDGLTTNGVLVMHPAGEFVGEPAPGVWREISVCGNVYALRETRSAQQRGKLVENESNTLQDGSLIDLCGATLLWRTPAGLRRTPTLKQLESLRQELNAARPQCPVGFNTLAFPSLAQRQTVDKKQPWVYVNCGHVHGYHNWGFRRERGAAGGRGRGVAGDHWRARVPNVPACGALRAPVAGL
ncbi:hypothetical protein SKAU_G00268750 [Synaphobranchus kaupii]|uniref:Pellino E3 ubiquitin protein ligase family member 3 n=1 Tax=Synaphobranchus kaupii TaxID=118154 RepID=A0A9Q1IQD3_SYNKA|nr:hypothetical protein SKAU_G00268750 [Synaphobranchus kaupii]